MAEEEMPIRLPLADPGESYHKEQIRYKLEKEGKVTATEDSEAIVALIYEKEKEEKEKEKEEGT